MEKKSLQISQIQILMTITIQLYLAQVFILFSILTMDIIQDNILNIGEIKMLSQLKIDILLDRLNGKESDKNIKIII